MKYVHVRQEARDRAMTAFEQSTNATAINAIEPVQAPEVIQ
jgi:hypothetical protein